MRLRCRRLELGGVSQVSGRRQSPARQGQTPSLALKALPGVPIPLNSLSTALATFQGSDDLKRTSMFSLCQEHRPCAEKPGKQLSGQERRGRQLGVRWRWRGDPGVEEQLRVIGMFPHGAKSLLSPSLQLSEGLCST